MPDNLSPWMRNRLEKWRKSTPPAKTPEIFKRKRIPTFVPRRRDYADELPKENNESKPT